MKPEHLPLLRTPGRPSVHPLLPWAVVAVSRPDLEADAYRSQLWQVSLAGKDPVQLTSGEHDSDPAVSPDGAWIAFIRRTESGPQLALMDARGGEARVLTAHPFGTSGRPVWSPDSRRIAYTAPVPAAERAEGASSPADEPARRFTTLTYRLDGVGFTGDRPRQVFALDVPLHPHPLDGDPSVLTPVRLTEGEVSLAAPVWSPDSSFLLALRERADAVRGDLVRIDVPAYLPPESDDVPAQAQVTVIETPFDVTGVAFGNVFFGRFEVDGEARTSEQVDGGQELYLTACALERDETNYIAKSSSLYRGDLGAATLTNLQRLTDPAVDDILPGVGSGALQVMDGGMDARVLVLRRTRGRVELVWAEPLEVTEQTEQRNAVRLIPVNHSGNVIGAQAFGDGRILATLTLEDSSGEVVMLTPTHEDEYTAENLTDLAAGLRAVAPARPNLELEGVSADGYPVHGWVVLPDPEIYGEGPHPVLLNIHGGPHAQYENTFFDETQAYVGAGYAVVFGNPRGSAGYGEAHARAIIDGFGDLDAQDVIALLDTALATYPELDATRQGVLGGSYGGYMTAWLTTRPEASRFTAAIVERGFLDPVSFVGSSDIGWYFGLAYLGNEPEKVAAQSPMAHIDSVTTPTLVIHSEHDWRCPVEQGQRWYVGLKRRGVETEFLLFPGEGHELSRSGRPRHRLQRFEAILEWWQRYLPVRSV